jgi:peptidoglycan/xylan/chitin deacetylase (PgdA/CDA1 family)
MSVTKRAKRALLRVVKGAGGFAFVRGSRWRGQRLLILCYHGVSLADEHEWSPSYYMSPEMFSARMTLLKDGGYAVLPLNDALEHLATGTLPPRSVALTFDDGSADFALRAFPILQRFGFPATVYLTTYYCGHPRPVFGVFCSYLLWKAAHRRTLGREVIGQAGEWDVGTPSARQRALDDLRTFAANLSTPQKDALAERIATALGLSYDDLVAQRLLQIMSPAEVDRLAAAGVRFELHTHRHRTPLDRALFQREVRENRDCIQSLAHQGATHFCYPSGVFEQSFVEWLREMGVKSATTCESGMASRRMDTLLLPRVVDGGQLSALEFESWSTGFAAFLPARVAHRPAR